MDPEAAAVALAAGGDGVVEVAGARRVDGEGRLVASGLCAARVGADSLRRRRRLLLEPVAGTSAGSPRSATRAATTSRARSARPRSAIGCAPRLSTRQSAMPPSPTLTRPRASGSCSPRANSGSPIERLPATRDDEHHALGRLMLGPACHLVLPTRPSSSRSPSRSRRRRSRHRGRAAYRCGRRRGERRGRRA